MEYHTPELVMRNFEGVMVVRLKLENLTGTLETERITRELEKLVDDGARKLVLDFKHVRYINSAALSMLIAIQKKVAGVKGKLVLSNPTHIEELLKVSRTERLFTLAPDPKTAARLIA